MSDRCKSCGASIVWALTKDGKHIPIDNQPVKGGNLRMTSLGREPLTVEVKPVEPEIYGWVSHFATCPNADEHRKSR